MSNPVSPEQKAEDTKEHHLLMGEALMRLRKNSDFKKVITEGYLKGKVMASWSLLAIPQERENRIHIMEDLIAQSNLSFFFDLVDNFYEGAKNPVLTDEEQELFDAQQLEQASILGAAN
jgi:hypothetical protein